MSDFKAMRDSRDRYQVEKIPALMPPKRLGSYLVDAGLITADQVNVALTDQQATGLRLGEVLVARGWLKEQTIEWVMARVVEPERRLVQSSAQSSARPSGLEILPAVQPAADESAPHLAKRPPLRRELPISKPLPSVKSADSDVNWVG